MSNKAINWAYDQTLKSGPKFTLVTLADYADDRNSCYPKIEQISVKTGASKKAVSRHLSELSDGGLITRIRTRNTDGTLGRYRFKLHLSECPLDDLTTRQNVPTTRHFVPQPPDKMSTHNPHTNPHTTTTTSAGDVRWGLIEKALGNSVKDNAWQMQVYKTPLAWVDGENGVDFELDLIPTITRIAEAKTPRSISTWRYFKDAVFEARDRRLAEQNNPAPKEYENAKPDYKTNCPAKRASDSRQRAGLKALAKHEARRLSESVSN